MDRGGALYPVRRIGAIPTAGASHASRICVAWLELPREEGRGQLQAQAHHPRSSRSNLVRPGRRLPASPELTECAATGSGFATRRPAGSRRSHSGGCDAVGQACVRLQPPRLHRNHGSTPTPVLRQAGVAVCWCQRAAPKRFRRPWQRYLHCPPSAARTIGPIAATWPSCGGRSGARENPETSSMETEAALLLRIAGHCAVTIFFSAAAPLAAATNPASVSTRTWHERDRRRQASAASQPA
jgi:hypothetical protein